MLRASDLDLHCLPITLLGVQTTMGKGNSFITVIDPDNRYGTFFVSTEKVLIFFLFLHMALLMSTHVLTHVLLNPDIPCFANSVDPDQLASEEAN